MIDPITGRMSWIPNRSDYYSEIIDKASNAHTIIDDFGLTRKDDVVYLSTYMDDGSVPDNQSTIKHDEPLADWEIELLS